MNTNLLNREKDGEKWQTHGEKNRSPSVEDFAPVSKGTLLQKRR